jgi:coenzyme F420 biosynthesis associated uncharacterized protein
MPLAQARGVVSQLGELAELAAGHVEDYTGLVPAPGVYSDVAVVDRGEWSRSNASGLAIMVEPLLERLGQRRSSPPLAAVGRRVTALELGGVLAWLSTKVLGQYEVFLPDGEQRLALVAPNIVEVERRMGVDPHDFRLWVCLHEQTHRTQFTAVPWMRTHLEELIGRFVEATDLDPGAMLERALGVAKTAVRTGQVSPLDLIQSPEQREIASEIQSLMTLLEGHAEQVMDAVGPAVVPTVELIRARFDTKRNGGNPLDRVVRRLLGLEAKLDQYRTGGRFVRAVVEQVGVGRFNEVWRDPGQLPTEAELRTPGSWIDRVHGVAAAG